VNVFITVFYDWSRTFANSLAWLAPLAARITVGVVFIGTGWTKLTHLPQITKNFAGMGIPAPEILTPFVSGVEFVGGILLLLGLLTRFAAVPLMLVMVVAIVAAQWENVQSLEDFLGLEEVSYFVLFAGRAIAGPGPMSLDHLVLKFFRLDKSTAEYGA
jgi:putative oxidoreductase